MLLTWSEDYVHTHTQLKCEWMNSWKSNKNGVCVCARRGKKAANFEWIKPAIPLIDYMGAVEVEGYIIREFALDYMANQTKLKCDLKWNKEFTRIKCIWMNSKCCQTANAYKLQS